MIALSTIKKYKEKVQCIIDQYSGYSSKQVNRKVFITF